MKRTLLLQSDSCSYYFYILEDGKLKDANEYDWCDYETNTDQLLEDIKKDYGEFDYIYWLD